MPLSAELHKPLPSFRPTLPSRLEIHRTVNKLIAKWGEPGHVGKPEAAEHIVAAAEQALNRTGGDLSGLSFRYGKAVVQLLWRARPEWGDHRAFVRRWLDWADTQWRPQAASKRVWRQHLLRFDADSVATHEVAAWLRAKTAALTDAQRAFSFRWRLFDVTEAASVIAESVFAGDEFAEHAERLGIARGTVRGASLMASVLEAIGKALLTGRSMAEPDRRLESLLVELPGALQRMDASADLLRRARGSLADGLVRWAIWRGDEAAQHQVLDLLLKVMDDPRLAPAAWDGVSAEARQQVEAWLSRKTLEVFFKIIDRLNTDTPYQWPYRKAFWESYLGRISRAWLLCGRNAKAIADQAGVRCGVIGGGGVNRDHCALMMQIGRLTVIEMNKNASALFFDAGNPNSPRFYLTDDFYDRNTLIHSCDEKLAHNGSAGGYWQRNFADFIEDRTGIKTGR